MQIRELLSEDDAVSPVIGVILMVAITVILAAVIASFVLGLGDDAMDTQPQASFSFDYDGDTNEGDLTITHDGGDSIEAQELYVRGSSFGTADAGDNWHEYDDATPSAGQSEVNAGHSTTVEEISAEYEVSIVYEPVEGGSSATLATDSGPQA